MTAVFSHAPPRPAAQGSSAACAHAVVNEADGARYTGTIREPKGGAYLVVVTGQSLSYFFLCKYIIFLSCEKRMASVETWAGSAAGESGFEDGTGANARFSYP